MPKRSLPVRLFRGIARLFAFLRATIANALVLALLLIAALVIFQGPDEKPPPMDGAALVIDFDGPIVEQRSLDPMQVLLAGEQGEHPLLLRDLLRGIDQAAQDDRIAALVLDPTALTAAAPAQIEAIGDALDAFRDSGKRIVAKARFMGAHQYYLASFADDIYLHPFGGVGIDGYGIYNLHVKDLLDSLAIDMHVFQAGDYKSAAEPFARSSMSDEAREAYQALLDDIWQRYLERVAANRDLEPEALADYANRYDAWLAAAGGNAAQAALERGLVDALLTGGEIVGRLRETIAADGDSYRRIKLSDYLRPALQPATRDTVAVVTATGVISAGDARPGTIGANDTIKLLRRARKNDAVKALVLRLDTPGGSAFASERIRAEVEQVRAQGKPVVVSMGSMAASGGYWIAAAADEIWAAPTTLTGSIGVIAILPNVSSAISRYGIRRDGVATGPFAAAGDPFAPLAEPVERALQSSIGHVYERFVGLVSEGRGMSAEDVEAIAGGRIWSGDRALRNGLVDRLGHLRDAIGRAAELAGLETYRVRDIKRVLSPQQELLMRISEEIADASAGAGLHGIGAAGAALARQWSWLGALDDPGHAYAICQPCLGW